LPAARIGDSDKLLVGEPVVAIGHALALPGGPTVSTGVVSGLGRSIDTPNGVTLPNLIQTDAAINPGNSGGPLLDARGQVIGINTAGAAQAQGISFAVAINTARPAMDSVVATGRVRRPVLGIEVLGTITPALARANGLPTDRGVMVRVPDPSGPAGRAGVRDGDIIVAADGQDVRSSPDLLAAIRRHQPGEPLRLRIVRAGGATLEVTVTLGERVTPAS
jgi:S1-C subfamily serine protease